MGSPDAERVSIVSLRFMHGDKDLHYGFVVSLLNDLFGIQVRGGCSCAGPYGHSLLDMDMEYSPKGYRGYIRILQNTSLMNHIGFPDILFICSYMFV